MGAPSHSVLTLLAYYRRRPKGRGKRKREKEAEKKFEDTTAENLPNLGKEKDIQVQEAQRVADRINSKKTTPRHTVIKNGKN